MHLNRRVGDEGGIALVTVMFALLVGTLFSLAAFTAAGGDLPLSGKDSRGKQAYAAAESGLAYYAFHLRQDGNYWANCANVPVPGVGQPSPVNQIWNGQGVDPRVFRALSGSKAEYALELLPANGAAACDPIHAQDTMIDSTTGTFQLRSTGRVGGDKRSIVATMRRKTFLDYLYFTDFETIDPVAYQVSDPSQQNVLAASCPKYRRAGRPEPPCSAISFAAVDKVSGPLHTNDDLRTCGAPTFGRNSADPIEVSGPAPGWDNGSCTGSPNFLGTLKVDAPILAMPTSNTELSTVVQPAYSYVGTTTIHVTGSTMTVTNAAAGLNNAPRALPTNGVIYVRNGICGTGYSAYQDYNQPTGCAILYIDGTYSQSLTVASENDIVVKNDLTRTGNAVLGLISNNFVRIYHPVVSRSGTSCTNSSSSPRDIDLDAAVLSLQHSLIVDNYYCGAPLGTLTLNGAVAQRFRGPVGTGGTTIATGYAKNYMYDDRLKTLSPPNFLSPVEAAWEVVRQNEERPAR
jgi:hypothetical protein